MQFSSPNTKLYCHITKSARCFQLPLLGAHIFSECFSSQMWNTLVSFLAFLSSSSEKQCWLKGLFLPVVLEESNRNEKQSSSINTTACSAGVISYLLLNSLIGYEVEKGGVWRRLVWFSCEIVVLLAFVGVLVESAEYIIHLCIESRSSFTAQSPQSHSQNEHCLISISKTLSLLFI